MSSTQRASRTGYKGWVMALMVAMVALVMPVTASSAEVVDRIVAQVNDRIITLYELEQAAVPFLIQRGQNPAVLEQEGQREAILEEVLEDQVEKILLEIEAENMGIEVQEAQIEEWLQMTAQQQNLSVPQFRQLLQREGIDFETYREMVTDNILRMQLMQARAGGGGVSRSDIDAEYRRRFGSDDGMETRLTMRHILLVPDGSDQGLNEAIDRLNEMRDQILEGEASFEELAEAYSQGPGADRGGHIGTFGRGELAESFEEKAFEQPVGQISGPVVTDFGVHLIEVLDSEEAPSQQVEQRRQQIEAELRERQMERRLGSMVDTLRERAFVDIRL